MSTEKEFYFISAAFGIVSGILAFSEWGYFSVSAFIIVLAISLVMSAGANRYKEPIVVIFSIFAIVGAARLMLVPEFPLVPEGKITLQGVIESYPDMRDDAVYYEVCAGDIGGKTFDPCVPILVGAERFPEAEFGDVITAEGTLEIPGIIEDDSGREFDYGAYLKGEGFAARMSFAKVKVVKEHGASIRGVLFALRQSFSRGIEGALPEPQSGFLKGIILGEKHASGKEIEDAFRGAGLSHLVVLSGYNVMVVIAIVLFLAKRVWLRTAPYMAGAALLGFVLMTGASETAVRAGLMAGLMLFGLVLRRQYIASRALALVVIGFAIFDPLSATSLSFLLSSAATFAVIHVSPFIASKLGFMTEKFGLRESTATTIAAQIFVAPLILFSIGSIPILSLIANILVLLVMPAAMAVGAIAAIAGMIGFFPMLFAFPAYLLLSYVIFIAKIFGSIPLSFSVSFFPAIIAWFSYVFLILFSLRKKENLVVSS